jgi:hypothetical protein
MHLYKCIRVASSAEILPLISTRKERYETRDLPTFSPTGRFGSLASNIGFAPSLEARRNNSFASSSCRLGYYRVVRLGNAKH